VTELLNPSETDELLHMAQRFLEAKAEVFRRESDLGVADRRAVWLAAAELGLPYLLSSETRLELGNCLAVSGIFKLIGRSLLPDYLIDAIAVTPVLVAACGPEAEAVVGSIRDGSRYVATALIAEGEGGLLSADPFEGAEFAQGLLSGDKHLVRDGGMADGFLVACRTERNVPAVVWVSTGPGVSVVPQRSIDPLAAPASVTFKQSPAVLLAEGDLAEAAVTQARNVGKLVVVSEIAGVADAVTAMTVEYAGVRAQFGRAIGSYQSIKHLLADLWREAYQVDCVRLELAARIAGGTDAADIEIACAQGKAWAGPFIRRSVETALQIFGGIGFTAEGPLARHYLRALTLANAEGGSRDLARWIGRRTLEMARQ
jgi:alkylation response protein AidB-like acyl-CoA dehydrogenase